MYFTDQAAEPFGTDWFRYFFAVATGNTGTIEFGRSN